MNYYEIVKNEPLFWSRIGLGANPDVRNEQGEITFLQPDWSHFLEEHKQFAEKGCILHTTVIHSGWVGENTYDYSATDKTLETIFSLGENIFYLPRVELNPPLEWLKANPSEIALAEFADRDINHIAETYKSYKTDKEIASIRVGSINEKGIYMQSFCSDKWVKDASEALRRFIRHLEDGPYGDRIAGYQLAYGMCGELCAYGAWKPRENWGDFSKPAQKAFLDFCTKKYGDFEAVKQAYNMPELTMDNIIPSPKERLDNTDYFRQNHPRAIDFSLFHSDRNVQNVSDFAKVLKSEADKPTGCFYGYLLTKYPTETGHIAVQKIMDCPDIDFLTAPKIYYRCGAGQPSGSQAVSMSVARKKIWLDELDNDTHIAQLWQEDSNHPTTFSETKTILWREVARNLAWHNQNFWWMDLYGGWFEDEEIMQVIGQLVEFNRNMRKQDYQSVSEILFVTDEKALAYQTADEVFTGCRTVGILNQTGAELKLCGAPVDEYRLEDLKDLPLSQYKMIVFNNAFVLDKDMQEIIKNIPETTLCLWNYGAGLRLGETFDFENTKKITGMSITPSNQPFSNNYGCKTNLPSAYIKDCDGLEVLTRYDNGTIKTAKCKNHIINTACDWFAEDFRTLAKSAGCHIYTDVNCAVFADKRFVGIFPSDKVVNGVHFKQSGTYTEVIEKTTVSTEQKITIPAKGAAIFIQQKAKG